MSGDSIGKRMDTFENDLPLQTSQLQNVQNPKPTNPNPDSENRKPANPRPNPQTQNPKDEKLQPSFSVSLLCGGFAGLFSDAVVHPLDTLRARQQVLKYPVSLIRVWQNLIRQEGPLALYKGFSAVAIGTLPGHALYFAGYEQSKRILNDYFGIENDDNAAVHLCAGLIADIAGSLVWTPMDVVKQRGQVAQEKGRKSFVILREVTKEQGFRGLYRGFGAGLMTYGPFVMIYMALYERMKLGAVHWFNHGGSSYGLIQDIPKTKHDLPFYLTLSLSAFSGCIASFVTTPMDVIKTRMQTSTEYQSMIHGATEIWKKEGGKSFFKGAVPRMVWIAGGSAVTMMAYEKLKQVSRDVL